MLESQHKQLIKSIQKDITAFKDEIYDLRKKICYAENEIKQLEKDLKVQQTRDLFTNCGEDKNG
jgi:peptidoglycan hydrolase CwlO-like protein|tara:strand:- start:401 stop:592 length:192 start_codon:yes stop_codon:yes gene_type:complete